MTAITAIAIQRALTASSMPSRLWRSSAASTKRLLAASISGDEAWERAPRGPCVLGWLVKILLPEVRL